MRSTEFNVGWLRTKLTQATQSKPTASSNRLKAVSMSGKAVVAARYDKVQPAMLNGVYVAMKKAASAKRGLLTTNDQKAPEAHNTATPMA
ncbi:hypothetical protein GCM10009416_29820 [Craurococcus roseus]|uniref:Uncharacterized protein n=2 Tax=Craurococcus roseus TaxID=77585 RepID=A0ABN1FET6_9PROT